MADLKPIYLVYGDDDARIDEWRSRVRMRAEEELGPGGLESFDPKRAPPEEWSRRSPRSPSARTRATCWSTTSRPGRRASWSRSTDALAAMPPDTVLVLIVRGKPPLKALVKAVGGGRRRGARARGAQAVGDAQVGRRPREAGTACASTRRRPRPCSPIVGAGSSGWRGRSRSWRSPSTPRRGATARTSSASRRGRRLPKVYDLADAVVAGRRRGQRSRWPRSWRAQGERPAPARLPGRQPPARGAPAWSRCSTRGSRRRTCGERDQGPALEGEEGGGPGPQGRQRDAGARDLPLRRPRGRAARRRHAWTRRPPSRWRWRARRPSASAV